VKIQPKCAVIPGRQTNMVISISQIAKNERD
jgi:hypothetical protein